MKRFMLLLAVSLLILTGCADLKAPLEPPEGRDGSSRLRPASPFYDATRPPGDDGMTTLESRPEKELDAFRERHR